MDQRACPIYSTPSPKHEASHRKHWMNGFHVIGSLSNNRNKSRVSLVATIYQPLTFWVKTLFYNGSKSHQSFACLFSSVLMRSAPRPPQHRFLVPQGSAYAEFSVLIPLLPQFYVLNIDFSCISFSFLSFRWPYKLLRHVDMLHICLHQQDLSHTLSPVNTIVLDTCVLRWSENSWHQYYPLQKYAGCICIH